MNCNKCGRDIEGLLACRHCAKVASAIAESRTMARSELACLDRILRGNNKIWVQSCTCSGEPRIQHLAFALWINFKSVSFCGHDISMGKCSGSGMETLWKEEYRNDPELCPLCVDRLLNLGDGICSEICSMCGGADGKHDRTCPRRPLIDKALVNRLGGHPVLRPGDVRRENS